MDQGELKRLQREWYGRLKSDGFRDIERMDRDGSMDSPLMENTASSIAANYDSSVEEYYRLARMFLNEDFFESPLARFCWGLHSEGVAYREIVNRLAPAGFKKYSLFFIQGVIRRARGQMLVIYKVKG